MTKSYSEDNLFTTFNNIEKIKKEKQAKQERKLNTVIRVEEMIKTIKEHYNLNAPMLANNLGVDVQSIYKWEKGGRPSVKRYNKIKELYEEIVKEDKTEVLEQPETANKEVAEDITAGTPFIKVTFTTNGEDRYVNINKIKEISVNSVATVIKFSENDYTYIKEDAKQIFKFIRKSLKENEKN